MPKNKETMLTFEIEKKKIVHEIPKHRILHIQHKTKQNSALLPKTKRQNLFRFCTNY